jgi:hypothetical protein
MTTARATLIFIEVSPLDVLFVFRSPQEQATVLSEITKMLNKRYAQSGTASSWLPLSSIGLLLK